MAENSEEFQVRTIFDFTGEDVSELSFKIGEILTITSTEIGEGWWSAKNTAGDSGVIPANYVTRLDQVETSETPVVDENPQELPAETSPSTIGAPEVLRADSLIVSHDSSTVLPSIDENTSFDRTDVQFMYPSLPGDPSSYSNSQTTMNTNSDVFVSPMLGVNPYSTIDMTIENTQYTNTTSHFAEPVFSSPQLVNVPDQPVNNPQASYSQEVPPTTNTASSTPVQAKSATLSNKSSGFFTFGRKTEPEPSSQPATKNDSDSDSFSDSGSHQTNQTPKPSNEQKGVAKARFFEKHGLDTYLLNGTKLKFDESSYISFDEKTGSIYWVTNPSVQPFTCKVEEPSKASKLGGFKTFIEYKIQVQNSNGRSVNRRYKHFDWLHDQLMNKFCFICIPQLPGKQIAGRFEQDFVEERRRQLELWLNRICSHPVLCASFPVQHFVTCELTEKNNKEWKLGKRRSERDEIRAAAWLQTVTVTSSQLSENQLNSMIDVFVQQQPSLEANLRTLSQGIARYVDRQIELYDRDAQRIGELFAKFQSALVADTNTPGNQMLANCIGRMASSYNAVAELHKSKGSDGLKLFNEHLGEYLGLLSYFPSILNVHRSAVEFIRTVQQRGPTATPDFNGALQRYNVLNHVVLAEISHFQRNKVTDLHAYIKTVMAEQIRFYEKVTTELRESMETFG